jgi:hypothetical protein
MSDTFSIPYLLKQIRAPAFDGDLHARCLEAERLSRQHDFASAIGFALATVDIAMQTGVSSNVGLAFLYLAVIHHAAPRKDAHDQAPEDSKTALEWLKRDRHHVAIAHLIHAHILLDDGHPRVALKHYRRADEVITGLTADWHRRNNPEQEKYYTDLQHDVRAAIKQIEFKPHNDFSASAPPSGPSSPPKTGEARGPDQFVPQFYDVSRVWINGLEYLVETVKPISSEHPTVRLLPDQKYIAIPIDTKTDEVSQRFVLVREQKNPELVASDQPRQCVVEVGPTGIRAWVHESELSAPFVRLHTLGTDREIETAPKENVSIVGTVEAKLSPASADVRLSASPPPIETTTSTEIDYDLLQRLDSVLAAQNIRGRLSKKDLKVIQDQLFGYLQRKYKLEVIPITPGETEFDPKLGHNVVGLVNKRNVQEGVITSVERYGYTREGKVVRDANVVVNQKKAK